MQFRMKSDNLIQISGYLTKDAKANASETFASFSIAHMPSNMDVMYFQCVVFSKDRKLPTDLLLKGKEVFVKGSLRPNNYTNMKSTEHFKKTLLAYLDKRALEDKLFAVAYQKPGKNIEDCITYILNKVKKSGCNGFADEEIYSISVHYYDEDNIKAGQRPDCQVIVNHTVELTEEEKAEARQRAVLQYQEAERKKLENRHKKTAAKQETNVQPSLFDF